MFVRLRDLAYLIFCDCQICLDMRNCNVHETWVLHYDTLPSSVMENLIEVPRLSNDERYEIACSFAKTAKDNHPELYQIFLDTNKDQRVCMILDYIDEHQLFDIYQAFAQKYIVSKLRKWCIANHIPYGM